MWRWVVELVGNDRRAYLGHLDSVQGVWMIAKCFATKAAAERLMEKKRRWAARNGWMTQVVKMGWPRQRLRQRERL